MEDIRRRSSYSAQNTLLFKNHFDDAIVGKKDLIIERPRSRSQESWRQKITDALLYLIRNNDYEHEDYKGRKHNEGDYAKYRGQVRIKVTVNGDIHINYHINHIDFGVHTLDRNTVIGDVWKDRVEKYLQDSKPGEPLAIKELYLAPQQQNIVRDLFDKYKELTGHRVIYEVTQTEIYAMKMKES